MIHFMFCGLIFDPRSIMIVFVVSNQLTTQNRDCLVDKLEVGTSPSFCVLGLFCIWFKSAE